jgi:hypothetical protein
VLIACPYSLIKLVLCTAAALLDISCKAAVVLQLPPEPFANTQAWLAVSSETRGSVHAIITSKKAPSKKHPSLHKTTCNALKFVKLN